MEETVREIVDYVPEFMEGEDRTDSEFRYTILANQAGDAAFQHLTETDEPPEVAFGDFYFQFFCLLYARDIPFRDVTEHLGFGDAVELFVSNVMSLESPDLESRLVNKQVAKCFHLLGRVGRHISHDSDLNPNTRPLEENESEVYNDLLREMTILGSIVDIDFERAFEVGLERCRNREGYLQQTGTEMEGRVVGDRTDTMTGTVGEDIYVTREFNPEDTVDLNDYRTVVTEVGGITSHAATVAREHGIPAIVGVPNLTDIVNSHDTVELNFESGKVELIND